MNKYISIINTRTLIALLIAGAMLYISFIYEISYNIDLTLLSIAIIFPLVFNIRGSFRRREKALEHLSQFRSALKTIHYLFITEPKLSDEDKKEITDILLEISDTTMSHLRSSNYSTKKIDMTVNKISLFVSSKDTLISRGLKAKIFRFLNDIHESVDNLNAIHVHRTPVSLKAYCEFFIYLFPLIYVPAILFKVGLDSSRWVTILIVMFSQFILISLYNIQDQMEYPFDDVGLDDINLSIFRFNR
jgi:predicted membrane chloride channel (bestrophin family)